MKKLLYTTSALVGAAFLMEAVVPAKAEVNISLRYRAALETRSQKDTDKDNDIKPTTKETADEKPGQKDRSSRLNSAKINIGISGSKDHPNGLTTSATIDMVSAGNKWDYNNAFGSISGSFGKVDIGDFHDVGYRTLGYGTPGTSNFGAVDPGFNPAGVAINTSATGNIGARASGVAYWSPSFSGAQVGISWHPQVTTGVNDDTTGVEGKKASFTTKDGDVEDSMAFVASYSGSFGGTGVSMGVAYETAKVSAYKPDPLTGGEVKLRLADGKARDATTGSPATAATTISLQTQDPSAYAGYISFDIDNFTVGGSYGVWEGATVRNDVTNENTAYALGASYSVDAVTFGIGFSKQDTDNTHHDVRTGAATTSSLPVNDINALPAYKQTLSKSKLAFTVGYQLGDGAALDFVIEQASAESHVAATDAKAAGKKEAKTSGFGVGIDLKF